MKYDSILYQSRKSKELLPQVLVWSLSETGPIN